MTKYPDPEFCKCGHEITETNRPQKYGVEEHVVEGLPTFSYTVTACNRCLNMPPSASEKINE